MSLLEQRSNQLLSIPGLIEEILKTSIQGILILRHNLKDLTTRTFFANQRAAEIVDVKIEDLIDANPGDYLHPEDDKKAEIEIMRKVILGQSVSLSLKLIPFNGIEKSIVVKMELISKTANEAYIFCLLTDMTEQEKMLFQLQQSEKFFRTFIERLPALVFILENDGTITFANKLAVKITGYDLEKNDKLNVMSILDEAGQRLLLKTRKELDEDKNPEIRHYRLITANGEFIPVEGTAVKMFIGSDVKFVGVAIDVRRRIKAEQEQAKMQAKMIQVQKLEGLGVMAGGIAHDFNNIFAGIQGYLELIRKLTCRENEKLLNYLVSMEESLDRATELANQMMAYAGISQFSIKSFMINDLIKEMVLMLTHSISKKANLKMDLEPNVPVITGDMTQIRQIIMNLITNASEALGNREGDIVISTKLENITEQYFHGFIPEAIVPGTYVVLEISDTGCGMDNEVVSKMFDPFFSTKFTGRGLGLAAVLGIIRGHKGAINVYSEPDHGTVVKVYLPVQTGDTDQLFSDLQSTPKTVKDYTFLAGKTILVIDDDDKIRDTMSQYFYTYDCNVLEASDGKKGLELYLANYQQIDLVILDLTMPRLGGKEVLIELKKRNPLVRILLISGYAEQEALKKFRKGDVAGFMRKPLKFDKLINTLIQTFQND